MPTRLQKGTIDGCFVDYGGADTAFHLGGIVKYTTEMYSYVSSFGVVMNPASFAKLPPDLQKLIDDTMRPRLDAIGKLWDSADAPGKKYLTSEGDTPIKLSADQDALFKKIGAEDTAKVLAALGGKGLPAIKGARCHEGRGRQIRQDVILVLECVSGASAMRALLDAGRLATPPMAARFFWRR